MLQKLLSKTVRLNNLIFIALVCWQLILFVRLPNFLWDAEVMVAWFVKNGLKFYVDFNPGGYLPLLKLLMIPLSAVFKWNINLTIYLALVLSLATLFSLYKISSNQLSKRAALITITFYSMWYGYLLQQNTVDMNLFMGLMTLLLFNIFFEWIEKPRKKHLLSFGFLASIAFFSQQMSIVPIGIIALSIFLFDYSKKRKVGEAMKKIFFPMITGFLPIAVFIFLYFLLSGTFSEFINATFLYFFDSRYPGSEFSYNPKDIKTLVFLLIPFATTFFVFIGQKMKGKRAWKVGTLLITIFLITISILLAVVHQRRYLFILPLVSFSLGITYDNLFNNKEFIKKTVAFLFLLGAYYFISTILPWYNTALIKGRAYEISTLSQPGDYVNSAVVWIKNNTPPDSKIHVFGPMTLYYETQRLPANNRTYSALPWTYEPFEETKALFTQKPADYWLVDERQFVRFRNWGYGYQADFIRNLLDAEYEKIENYDWMSIYKLK